MPVLFGKGKAKVLLDECFAPAEGTIVRNWEILAECKLTGVKVELKNIRQVIHAMKHWYPEWNFEYVGYVDGGPGYVPKEG